MEVSYFTASRTNPNIPGLPIAGESLVLSASSARTGATPANAVFVKVNASEACRVDYSGATSTAAATSASLAEGEVLWMDAMPGWTVAGITA